LINKAANAATEALDIIAERIRMIGGRAPGSMHRFIELSNLDECHAELSGEQMLLQPAEDHTYMADSLRQTIDVTARQGDEGTADMLINPLRAHEKSAWMLRSHLT
jgi:starvation-inducible DNA-binding protein